MQYEKHQLLSSTFVKTLFADNLVENVVLNHHSSDLFKSDLKGTPRILAEILCEADNLASMERKPDDAIKKQQPFESIFSKVDYNKDLKITNIFQPISELSYANYKFVEDKYDADELDALYSKHWNNFKDEIGKQSNELETIFFLLKKYLWCVPSSSWKTRSDVSLFEHSKITSAIATSMYKYLMESCDKTENIPIEKIADRLDERYLLILADVTGIQKYIYNISHKGASKALKGRSFFLQQMLDNIAYWILDKQFNLPISNLIYSSGGKFYIFAPKSKYILDKLKEVQKILGTKFLEEYDGDLGIIFGSIPLSGNDLRYDEKKKEHLISDKWDELNKIVEQNKKHKFSNHWDFNLFKPKGIDGDVERCAATGKELIKKTELEFIKPKEVPLSSKSDIKFNKYSSSKDVFYQIIDNEGNPTKDFISKEQFISQMIGAELRSKKNVITIIDQISEYSVLDLNSFSFRNRNENYDNKYGATNIRNLLVNELDFTNIKSDGNKGFKYYGGDWRLPDTYEEVIKNGVGIERLGVLRLDVDNLGLIFKDGLGTKATFGRVVQLSSMLDFFFSCYLNKLSTLWWNPMEGICEKKKNDDFKIKDLIEIVYSGGDDVFIVGHWSILPDVAIWINDEFKKFTSNNPNFTISAGISLFDDKYPIYKAALEAGEFEDSAKIKERINRDNSRKKKDGISFLDSETPVSWSDFKIISTYVKTFYVWLEIGQDNKDNELKKISKGLISRLYFIHEEYKSGKYQNWAKWRWRASYSLTRLARQYKDPYEKKINDFASELFTSNKTEQELVHLLFIIANWTDLLTRKKEKENGNIFLN